MRRCPACEHGNHPSHVYCEECGSYLHAEASAAVATAPDWAEEAARYEAVTRSAGQGVSTIDLAGALTYANPAAEALLGWDAASVAGRDLHETLHATRAHARERCPLLGVLRTGLDHAEADDVFARGDGDDVRVGYVASPIFAGERIVGAVLAFWPR